MDKILLEKKMADGRKVIAEAIEKYGANNIRVAWTGGKDSTLVLYMVKQVCDELGIDLIKCFNIDEGDMFPEMVEFIEDVKALWNVNMTFIHNDDVSKAANNTLGAEIEISKLNERNRREIDRLGYEDDTFTYEPESYVGNHLMKTVTLNKYLEDESILGFYEGIRWDEQASRANETYFSIRKKTPYSPEHMRFSPILHFTERDVWDAHFEYEIPICKLYSQGYRSLGAKVSTSRSGDIPAWEQDLDGTYERGGRRQDKEELMEKLRSLGYM